jgi:hypothetical protein
MFNILSCLSHISFRVGLKIKFTMPYIFIDSQINYAVDIQASLVSHEHSRLFQSIWSQKYIFSTSSRRYQIRRLTRKIHLYLQGPGFVHYFSCVGTLKKQISLKKLTRCIRVVEFIIPMFLNCSTRFTLHTAHHQELKNCNCSL